MARCQAGAAKPHSGGKAIVLAGRIPTHADTAQFHENLRGCGCRKRSSVPFHCFRVVLYNERCNSDVSARARHGNTFRHTWRSSVGPGAFEDTRSIGIRSCAPFAATLPTSSPRELGMSHLATGWSGLRAWSATHDAELRLCV